MGGQWYCRMMGTEMGPYSVSQLVEMARQKRLTPEDWVRKGDSGQWVAAYLVDGIFEAAASPASASTASLASADSGLRREGAGLRGSHRKPVRRVDGAHQSVPSAPVQAESAARSRVDIEWFCISRGEKMGPLSFAQLRCLADDGRIDPKARVWSTAAPKWCRATDVPGLIR